MRLLAVLVAPVRPANSAVSIHGFAFKPDTLFVAAGTSVVWTNQDEIAHSVTADSGAAGEFSGVLDGAGKAFRFTFTHAGTFPYACARHSFMRGVVRVTSREITDMHALRTRVTGLLAVLAFALTGAGMSQGMSRTPMAASDLRVGLNTLLEEHIYLASAATGAALGRRSAEFGAAAQALDSNSVALSQAIGSVYGNDAGSAFLALWRKHIGFVVDYTTGLAGKDRMRQDKAVQDLLGYANDFGAFLHSACPGLPTSVVADLVRGHVTTLKTVIDAQAAMDPKLFVNIRAAAAHMQMIADPLAAAIAKQFPERFAAR